MNIDLPLKENTNGRTHLRISVKYCLGGVNMFTHKPEPRGMCVFISPIKIEEEFIVQSFMEGQRFSHLEMKKKNKRQEEQSEMEIQEAIRTKSGRTWACIESVLAETGLELSAK